MQGSEILGFIFHADNLVKYTSRGVKNPYLQYFIGFPGYQEESPFDASTLPLLRKRLTHEIIMEANEYILNHDNRVL